MNLGENIYKLRTERNLSQEELAQALEVSRQSVSKWETGASQPELDKLLRLSKVFGVTLDELVTGKGASQPKTHKKTVPVQRILGLLLFGGGLLALVLGWFFGDGQGMGLLALPLLLCALVCLFGKKNQTLWCLWILCLVPGAWLAPGLGRLVCTLVPAAATVAVFYKKPIEVSWKTVVPAVLGWLLLGLSLLPLFIPASNAAVWDTVRLDLRAKPLLAFSVTQTVRLVVSGIKK